VVWEFLEHNVDVHQTVAATPQKEDRGFDVFGWEFVDFVVAVDCAKTQWRLNIIIIHLEGFVPDDLKPVNYTFCAGEGVKMGIGSEFLVGANIFSRPVEEKRDRYVNKLDKYWWVED